MNINERLQEIDKGSYLTKEEYKWMHDTIKQLQEENERLTRENYCAKLGIAELEKEKRKITAAHEAFLKDLQKAYCLSEVEPSYHFYFDEIIHLAEQVKPKTLDELEQSFQKMQESGISPTEEEIEEIKLARFAEQIRQAKALKRLAESDYGRNDC